jgi:hypothetical protein
VLAVPLYYLHCALPPYLSSLTNSSLPAQPTLPQVASAPRPCLPHLPLPLRRHSSTQTQALLKESRSHGRDGFSWYGHRGADDTTAGVAAAAAAAFARGGLAALGDGCSRTHAPSSVRSVPRKLTQLRAKTPS